jgi:glucokinase
MDRAVKALAAGIASAVNLLDPEAVVLGGGMGSRLGDKYFPRIQARMQRHLFTADDPPAMHVAALGDYGGAIGASLLIAPRKPSVAKK